MKRQDTQPHVPRPRGQMVFWTDDPKPWWIVMWQPANGPGAYWIVDAAGNAGVAAPDELFDEPQAEDIPRRKRVKKKTSRPVRRTPQADKPSSPSSPSDTVARILSEDTMTLDDLSKEFPIKDRPHRSTIYRWHIRGVRGVRLEAIRKGGSIVSSKQALVRFIQATQQQA